jgi:hypothetical protein
MTDREYKQAEPQDSLSQPANPMPRNFGSTFEELFASGAPFWLKMIGGAIVTPLIACGTAWKMKERGEVKLPTDPLMLVAIVGAISAVGALLGGFLSIKDVVEARMDVGRPVAFPLKLLFGYGTASLLFVWFPGIIVLTFIVTMVFLT